MLYIYFKILLGLNLIFTETIVWLNHYAQFNYQLMNDENGQKMY